MLQLLLPLPLLVLLGMEHLMHWLLASWLLLVALSPSKSASHRGLIFGLCFLACLSRYESLFLVLPLLLLLAWERDWQKSFSLLGGALLAVLGFGGWSLWQGGTFLPLSISIKGHSPAFSLAAWGEWLNHGIKGLYENPFMLVSLLILLAGLLLTQKRKSEPFLSFSQKWMLILIAGMLIHIFFADIGGYRYEAYLIGLTGLGLLALLGEQASSQWPRVLTHGERLGWWALSLTILFPFHHSDRFFSLALSHICSKYLSPTVSNGKICCQIFS